MTTYTITEAQQPCTSDEWLANCPQEVRDFANKIKAAPQAQEPHVWMIQGSHATWKGEHAEMDAKAEAKRCGGTCYAYPLYAHPASMRILTDAERAEREKARAAATLEQFLVALCVQFRTRGG